VPPHVSEGRLRTSTQRLTEEDGTLDVTRMQEILRDHGDRGPAWTPGADPADEAFFTVCAHGTPITRTTASLVAELPASRERPWPVWIGFDTPCSSIFLPVYLDGLIPAELAEGGPQPGGESVWWIFHALGERVAQDGSTRTPLVRRAFEPLEIKLEADRVDAEARAMEAPNQDERARILTEFMARALAETLERTRELIDRLADP
jgi:dipeptidase